MRPVLPVLVCVTLAAAGCSRITESRFNPFNWFGPSETVATSEAVTTTQPLVTDAQRAQIVDARGLAGSVVAMSVYRTPDGAIVRATGTTNAPGGFNAQLVPTGIEGGVLTLAFRVQTPATGTGQGNEPRQITAAYLMSNMELSSIRSVRVQGAQNALVSRR